MNTNDELPSTVVTDETRQIVHAYHEAYCRGDLATVAASLGDPFTFSSPMMAFDTPDQHLAALVRFVPFITGCDLISELYGRGEATLVYDLHVSLPPGVRRCAEHFRVEHGRISAIMIIFDATPWHPIMKAAAEIRDPLKVAHGKSRSTPGQ